MEKLVEMGWGNPWSAKWGDVQRFKAIFAGLVGKVNVHLVSSTLASNSGEALVFSGTQQPGRSRESQRWTFLMMSDEMGHKVA